MVSWASGDIRERPEGFLDDGSTRLHKNICQLANHISEQAPLYDIRIAASENVADCPQCRYED